MAAQADLDRLRPLKDAAAIVGVGETDYAADYRTARGEATATGSGGGDSYVLAARAFRRALDDAGLEKGDIDGLCVGGPLAHERIAELLGLNPRWSSGGDAPRSVIDAVQAIQAGLCTTVACVYGNAQRSANVQYGGPQAMGGGGILSYVYYAPWGLTSQGALYALMFKRHQLVYGTTEEQLAAIPVALRKHATLNPNAIMRERPMSTEDYLNARYIVEPLRLFDYCLVNDGGVALIVQRADLARERRREPVLVSGFGWSELSVDATQLRPRIKDFYFPAHHDVVAQVYPMAGVTQRDIDVYATYDSFSVHLLFTLEGFGFCGEGESGAFIQDGRIEVGGELPCNTSGGMLSESYMQSWNQQVELVRQLRGGLGERQVEGAEVAQYAHDVAGKCMSLIYTKGG
ncbi:MAG: thiolase family protein [Chloroflexi bacterium]|nr:thiolase family protein [Chloroflexota bacterium]